MREVRNETIHLTDHANEHYFEKLGKKLSDPLTGTKSYWKTLKNILNKKKSSAIPPLLENGVFITNFQAKPDIFNELFVEQCSVIPNNSVLFFIIYYLLFIIFYFLICGKIFEKILFDKIYNHLCHNELLSPSQSGFRPGDSTVNQLIAITHQIHAALEEYPSRETRAVFLDISKAFNKVNQRLFV